MKTICHSYKHFLNPFGLSKMIFFERVQNNDDFSEKKAKKGEGEKKEKPEKKLKLKEVREKMDDGTKKIEYSDAKGRVKKREYLDANDMVIKKEYLTKGKVRKTEHYHNGILYVTDYFDEKGQRKNVFSGEANDEPTSEIADEAKEAGAEALEGVEVMGDEEEMAVVAKERLDNLDTGILEAFLVTYSEEKSKRKQGKYILEFFQETLGINITSASNGTRTLKIAFGLEPNGHFDAKLTKKFDAYIEKRHEREDEDEGDIEKIDEKRSEGEIINFNDHPMSPEEERKAMTDLVKLELDDSVADSVSKLAHDLTRLPTSHERKARIVKFYTNIEDTYGREDFPLLPALRQAFKLSPDGDIDDELVKKIVDYSEKRNDEEEIAIDDEDEPTLSEVGDRLKETGKTNPKFLADFATALEGKSWAERQVSISKFCENVLSVKFNNFKTATKYFQGALARIAKINLVRDSIFGPQSMNTLRLAAKTMEAENQNESPTGKTDQAIA